MAQNETHPSAARPAGGFNPFAPGYAEDPYPMLQQLREQSPVWYWAEGHTWLVSRYDDIVSVLRDERFTPNPKAWEYASPQRFALPLEMEELNEHGLFALSHADHARVRRLVSPAFTPRAVERLRSEVQAIVDELLDRASAQDTFDVATGYSILIPGRVMSSMLKIPREHESVFQRFTGAVLKAFLPGMAPPEEHEQMRADMREGIAMVGEVLEQRRKSLLENDMMSTLIQTEEQGDRLNKLELLSLVNALIVGGFETTVHLINFMVLNLLRRPELLAQMRAEPELMKGVVEEVLRHDSFGKLGIVRYPTEDVQVGGVAIKKGQMVMLMLNSALRDSAAFDKAEVFDIRRNTNASIAFGHGMHYCLGANLARLEGQVAVGSLVSRFPHLRLEGQPTFGPHPAIRKIESLPVRLRPQAV